MELRRFTLFCALSISCLQLLTVGICSCAEAAEEGFTLQIMFGADRKACQKLQEHLTAKGFDAHVYESVNDLGAKMYRVRVGTFKTKDEAAASASQLRADNFQCFVRPISSLPIERTGEPETAPGPAEPEPDPAVAAAGRDTRNLPESLKSKIKDLTQADNVTGAEATAPEDAGHIDEIDLAEEGIPEDESNAAEQPQLQAPEAVRRLAAKKGQAGDPNDNQSDSARFEQHGKPPAVVVGVAHSSRPDEKSAGAGQSAQSTKIYKYYNGQGILHLTNSYKKIPMELRKNIREISVFPIRIIAFDARDLLFKIEMDGEEKKLRLVDVKPGVRPPQGEFLSSFKEHVHNSQCRLTYDPGSLESGVLQGNLYLKTGESVGLDMVRRGIALSNQEKLPPNKRHKFLDAQERAKNKKMGIWQ